MGQNSSSPSFLIFITLSSQSFLARFNPGLTNPHWVRKTGRGTSSSPNSHSRSSMVCSGEEISRKSELKMSVKYTIHLIFHSEVICEPARKPSLRCWSGKYYICGVELNIIIVRYDYINSFILDYIAFSIHVSEVGGFYWYIIALQVGYVSYIYLILDLTPGLAEGNRIYGSKRGLCHQVFCNGNGRRKLL